MFMDAVKLKIMTLMILIISRKNESQKNVKSFGVMDGKMFETIENLELCRMADVAFIFIMIIIVIMMLMWRHWSPPRN